MKWRFAVVVALLSLANAAKEKKQQQCVPIAWTTGMITFCGLFRPRIVSRLRSASLNETRSTFCCSDFCIVRSGGTLPMGATP
jgi:hypothetical protein